MRAKSLVEPYFGGADRVFAYGSGLFSAHYNLGKWSTPGSSSTLLDFMVVVPELEEFHRKQMSLFPQHYGHRLLALGPKKVAKLQRDTPGKTLHLPYAKLNNNAAKYGIIQTDDALNDLNEWSALFASGRLHKGYISLLATDSTNRSFDEALYKNRVTALRTSLLLLPETFTLYELLSTLIGISYTGDCRRLLLLENQSKYRRIVADQWPYLARVYLSLVIPVLEEANQALLASPSTSARVFADMDRDNIIVERTSSLVNRLLRRLPSIEELEAQAEARLANTLSNEKTGHRLGQPISSIVGTLATTPGSPMAERLTVPRLFQPYLFDALPENLKRHAGKASVQIRFGRLFSPAELLAQHRHVKLGWGYPAPQDPPALQRAIRDMTRNSSLGAVKLSLNTITPSRTVRLI